MNIPRDIPRKFYLIYLDVCCLNRPFDDQTQARIRLETEAIIIILNKCKTDNWQLITSNALGVEGMIRFIQHFNEGQGDYTKERHQWLDNQNVEEVLQQMNHWKNIENIAEYYENEEIR